MDGLGLVLFGIWVVIYFVMKIQKDHAVNHYPIDRVDTIKMQADNCSSSDKQQRMIDGWYDKDTNHPY